MVGFGGGWICGWLGFAMVGFCGGWGLAVVGIWQWLGLAVVGGLAETRELECRAKVDYAVVIYCKLAEGCISFIPPGLRTIRGGEGGA